MPSFSSSKLPRIALLPEPERNPASFITSCIINGSILALLILFGTVAHHEIELRKMESTEIVFPTTPPPEIKVMVKAPPAPKLPEPPRPEIHLPAVSQPALTMPPAKPQVVTLAPQPKAALAAAPALTPQDHPQVTPAHLGDLNGIKPNPNATKPATVAALGNPNGGTRGEAETPRGVVGSTGFGNATRPGSDAGVRGKVASAGIPGAHETASTGSLGHGKVGAAGIPGFTDSVNLPSSATPANPKITLPVLLEHGTPEYTAEARQLGVQGDVVLRITIATDGSMVVNKVIHGLGHGLDESAIQSAPTYKFRPATENGQPVEYSTNIIVKFQFDHDQQPPEKPGTEGRKRGHRPPEKPGTEGGTPGVKPEN